MLSLLTPEGPTRHVAVVPFLRLTNDKSVYSQQEILAVWQFLILTDRNSEGRNSFVPPQLPKWPEGRRRSRGGGKAATFYQCSLNWPACRVNVCLPSVYLKRKCNIKGKLCIMNFSNLSAIPLLSLYRSRQSSEMAFKRHQPEAAWLSRASLALSLPLQCKLVF